MVEYSLQYAAIKVLSWHFIPHIENVDVVVPFF